MSHLPQQSMTEAVHNITMLTCYDDKWLEIPDTDSEQGLLSRAPSVELSRVLVSELCEMLIVFEKQSRSLRSALIQDN